MSGALYTVREPRLLGEMTWTEARDLLQRTRTCVLAAGSIEQHGPHLPLLSDFFQGEEFIRRIVRVLADRGVVVAGGFSIALAPAEDALSFPGTVSVRNETYIGLVTDVLESLYGHGFRFFPVVVAHEQTMGPLMSAVREFNGAHGDAAAGVLTGWYHTGVEAVKRELQEGDAPVRDGHAGRIETSRVLAARPELVRMEHAGSHVPAGGGKPPLAYGQYPLAGGGLYRPLHRFEEIGPEGFVGDARSATAELGDRSFTLAVEWLAQAIEQEFV